MQSQEAYWPGQRAHMRPLWLDARLEIRLCAFGWLIEQQFEWPSPDLELKPSPRVMREEGPSVCLCWASGLSSVQWEESRKEEIWRELLLSEGGCYKRARRVQPRGQWCESSSSRKGCRIQGIYKGAAGWGPMSPCEGPSFLRSPEPRAQLNSLPVPTSTALSWEPPGVLVVGWGQAAGALKESQGG